MRASFRRGRRRRNYLCYERIPRHAPRIALAGFCLLCLAFSASVLIARAADARRIREINTENRLIITANTEAVAKESVAPLISPAVESSELIAPNPTAAPEILPSAKRLLERNGDLAGWLDVECIAEINFAIVQRDNTYYLNHDFNQKKNGNGTAFLDEACIILPRDDNLTIYAHNMYDGAMFGKLNRMTSFERILEAPFTKFATLYEQDVYVPIAVLHCSVDPGAADYFAFSANRFVAEAAFDEHIARAKKLSMVTLPFDARYGDKLLTLATCIKNDSDKRLVVVLRALRADETREGLQALLIDTK